MKSKSLLAATAIAALTAFGASAHTVSIGYENAGANAVTVWIGSYQHNVASHHLEGAMNLVGVNGTTFGSTTLNFNLTAGAYSFAPDVAGKPAGLVDGTTNFYGAGGLNVPGLANDDSGFLAACPACGPVDHWQGVTFNGLTAGDYQFTYTPIANPSAEWDLWNQDFNGVFTLDGTVVNPPGVPLPAGAFLLFGALGALGATRRLKKS